MSASKRYIVLVASLALAGLMLVLVIGLAGAASGTWRYADHNGGQVQQLVTANISPTLLYARTNDSGVWKSADGGTTWQMTSVAVDDNSGDPNLWPDAMAVSTDGQTVYAATRHGGYSRIWRSTDGGDSWSQTQVLTSNVRALAVFSNTNTVVAGSANFDDRPLFYSTDGTTWQKATVTGPYTQANILTLAEGSMYAGGEVDPTGSGFAGMRFAAVYTSTNGIAWTLVFTAPPWIINRPIGQIVPDPSTANRAYALSEWTGDVYSTTNGGKNWTQLANQPGGGGTDALALDSQGRIYAANGRDVYRSTNNGATWGLMGQTADQKNISSIAVDPNDDNVLYFASDDGRLSAGVYKTPASYQVGAAAYEFAPANSGLHAYRANHVASNSADPNTIYAATGSQGVIRSTDGGQTWIRASEGVSAWADAVAVHPDNANIAYFGGRDIFWMRRVWRTDDGGIIWEQRDTGLPGNRIIDLVMDPATPTILYAAIYNQGGGNEGVYKTTDSALNWTATTLFTPTFAVAVHPTTPTILYAAANNEAIAPGLGIDAVYKSTDSGANWTQLVAGNSCIFDIIVNPISPTHVYATGCNGVFLKSTDDGANWDTPVTFTDALGIDDFPRRAQPGRLAFDSQENVIYVALGTYGLVASDDGGSTWSQVTGDGLPRMAMRSLFYQAANDTLFLGGSAGLWQLGGLNEVFLPIIMKNY